MKDFECHLAVEFHLIFSQCKSIVQEARGLNTEKKQKLRLLKSHQGCTCNELVSYMFMLLSEAAWWHHLLTLSFMVFIIHRFVMVTPPWCSNNLLLLLCKIFYCSLLLGGGKKHRAVNTSWQCYFSCKILCLLPSPPFCKCAQEEHVYTGFNRQTWASPVFWVDQLWTRRLLTAY